MNQYTIWLIKSVKQGVKPDHFWTMTPFEVMIVTGDKLPLLEQSSNSFNKDELENLCNKWPDEKV